MLTQLHIQGLAIIDSLSIDFSSGFNVITGETGAGKSILIKALSLLLGGKASAETVRHGREAATVAGSFEAKLGHPCAETLRRYSIPCEDDWGAFTILVLRSITNKGRSLAWINDFPVTIAVLKEFGATLIDIFGQHENQRLLDSTQHINYLDQFLPDREVLVEYRNAFHQVQIQVDNLTKMATEFATKSRDADYIAYRAEELNKFAPNLCDFEQVQELCRSSTEQFATVKALEASLAMIDNDSGSDSISRRLSNISRTLSKIQHLAPDVKPLADEAAALAARVEDWSFEIGRCLSRREVDEEMLEAAQERLARYQDLFRKLGVSNITELIHEKERMQGELLFLDSAVVYVQTQLKQIGALVSELATKACALSSARQMARAIVKERAERELHELAMPGAQVDVELTEISREIADVNMSIFGVEAHDAWSKSKESLNGLAEHGAEKAQFLLATNPGEPLHPLHKTASGGEVSRVMLALKKGLADGADTCILVFDEIDAGISGRVADIVGRKMQELSHDFQVICISHLAQVAAYADTHFFVHKFGKESRTESTITRLNSAQSEEEIARLLSGDEVTTSSLANARALISKARLSQKKHTSSSRRVLGSKQKRKSEKYQIQSVAAQTRFSS